ncbi:FTR1 family iron permease [Paenibacillus gansuensis]|uniref:FTR1 family protein n=1 Tax=Paenibacillus gansuensis TaxID=306542 RepID=A0ABW5PHJ6_9BACL
MDLQAFLITFREALEALLIVGIITTYLNRTDYGKWKKWVWLGVFFGIASSYLVALLFQVVFTGFGTMGGQNYLKIGIMLVSCGLLTHMVMFMAKQSVDFKGKVESKIGVIITSGSILNMVVHSYLVVLREGVETVFFFAAISGGDIQKAIESWGALLGLLAAVVVSVLFFRGTRKVPLGLFFRIVSMFLLIISAGLFVQAIGILQDLGLMGTLYRTSGGEIGEIYNLTWLMPEHPLDYEQYLRDAGQAPLLSGQIGIFFKAFLGYTQNPSLEEFLLYWLYYAGVLALLIREKQKHFRQAAATAPVNI